MTNNIFSNQKGANINQKADMNQKRADVNQVGAGMKGLTKHLALYLCAILLISSVNGFAIAADNYASWAEPSIKRAEELGLITENVSKDYIRALSREHYCELVVNMYEKRVGESISVTSNPFTDTSNPAIIKAYSLGVINGTSSTTFSPNSSVTREQAAVILINTLKKIESARDVSILAAGADTLPFADSDKISSWAIEQMKVAYANGIMVGDGTNVRPLANVSAQESVILVLNAYNMQEMNPQDIANGAQPTSNEAPGIVSVVINGGNIPLKANETVKLSYTLSDENATVSGVTWSSSANSVATVDQNGLVKAIGKGNAKITLRMTANGTSITDTTTIYVDPPIVALNSVVIQNPVRTIKFGDTSRFYMTRSPSTATVISTDWSSSNTSVATIDANGLATSKGAGTTTIKVVVTATDGTKKEATGTLTVTAPVAVNSISFSKASTEPMFVGTTRLISASIGPSGAVVVTRTWSSSDPAVATIDSSGRVSAISAGTTTIKLETIDRANSKFSASFVLTVKDNYTSSFTLGQSEYKVRIGETIYPELILSPPGAVVSSVSFTSDTSLSKIASVSSANRSVKGNKAGSGILTVKVTFEDKTSHTAQATIIVLPTMIESLSLTANKTVLKLGSKLVTDSSASVTYRINPTNASFVSVVLSSSDESVATVVTTSGTTASGSRQAKAVGPGTCVITATVTMYDGSVVTESLTLTVLQV